ncbi:helix-turn-helix domain-containing protein [Kitasatospora sp. NPDC001664]
MRSGKSNAEVSRALSVPYGTVGGWKCKDRARGGPTRPHRPACFRCDGSAVDTGQYTYLLGLYLGDGHIAQSPRQRSPSLSIACAEAWPGLVDAAERAVRTVLPDNSVCRVRRAGCRDVKVYSKHLPCLFPQHGPGKKHERRIALAPWQQELVEAEPWGLVRGLIHSDGCRIVNWAGRTVDGVVRRHEYPRYFFTNTSTDIVGIFTGTLDLVGVEWRSVNRTRGGVNVSVARRASVELMDLHVGPKY